MKKPNVKVDRGRPTKQFIEQKAKDVGAWSYKR